MWRACCGRPLPGPGPSWWPWPARNPPAGRCSAAAGTAGHGPVTTSPALNLPLARNVPHRGHPDSVPGPPGPGTASGRMRMSRSTTLRARGLWPVALAVTAGALVTSALGATPAVARAGGGYRQVNLVSDQHMRAPLRDTDLVNAWGLAASPGTNDKPGSPLWVADNGTDKATLYAGTGPASVAKQGLVVSVRGMAPTGQVFNPFPNAFMVRDRHGHTGASLFLFDTENGTIDGWSPGVGAVGKNPSTTTFVA